MIVRSDAGRLPFADRTFDLVIGSPPYVDARLYLEDGVNLGISRECSAWVEWMLGITSEALRVSKGLVLWVVAGVTRDRNYQPAPEGLLWRWWERGGECHCLRPVYWHRNGIPGSGGDQWFRGDIEYVLAFKRPGGLPWADNVANGHVPKWGPGGDMSNRKSDGSRAGERWMKSFTNGAGKGQTQTVRRGYLIPEKANPGNLLATVTGGGKLGNPLAHDNEAPYPVDVPKWFIASHAPPFTCTACGSAVELSHENSKLPAVQSRVSNVGFSPWAQQVLQPSMRPAGDDETEGELPGMRSPDPATQGNLGESLLFPGMLESGDSKEQRGNQGSDGDLSRLRPVASPGASDVIQDGIRHGASVDDVGARGEASEGNRGCPPQERSQGGQSHRELGTDEQATARLPAKAEKPHRVPVLRTRHRKDSLCPSCGADLKAPGAVRPGLVLDPFSGSGTTVDAALSLGRRGVGSDLRMSQCRLSRKRIGTVTPGFCFKD